MKFRTSLRYRVTLAFAMLGFAVSLGLAAVLYVLISSMEARLIAETLSTELGDYIARYQRDPDSPPPVSTSLRTFVVPGGSRAVPEALRALPAGLHEVRLADGDYFAEVRLSGTQRFILLYADRQIRHRDNQFKLFLAIGVLAMTLLSALIGRWLAGRVIAPVCELASRVAGLRPEDHPAPLSRDFPPDEVGELARDFDAYLKRLGALIEREQAFTADVSHELRTPLAVIEGATEVLLADQALDAPRRARVERIARAAREMSELVSALLLLAREEDIKASPSGCEVGALLRQVIEGHQPLLRHKTLEVELDIRTQVTLHTECTLLRVVLANLVRNAIYYTERGHVLVRLDARGVSVADTGVGMDREQVQRLFDRRVSGSATSHGIGLWLVRRICERYGWVIDVESRQGAGTCIRLVLQPAAAR